MQGRGIALSRHVDGEAGFDHMVRHGFPRPEVRMEWGRFADMSLRVTGVVFAFGACKWRFLFISLSFFFFVPFSGMVVVLDA